MSVFCSQCRYFRIGQYGFPECDAPKQEARTNYIYDIPPRCKDANPRGECKHFKPPLARRGRKQ